jgi:hypothetical protein
MEAVKIALMECSSLTVVADKCLKLTQRFDLWWKLELIKAGGHQAMPLQAASVDSKMGYTLINWVNSKISLTKPLMPVM